MTAHSSSLVDRPAAADPPDGGSALDAIRSRICNGFLVALAILAVPALGFSVYRAADIGWQPVMSLQVALVAAHFAVTSARRRLSVRLRCGYLVAFLMVLGAAGLASAGLVSSGVLGLFGASMMALLLFGNVAGVLVAGSGLIVIAGTYALLASGILVAPDYNAYAALPSTWLNIGSGLLWVSITVGTSIAAFNKNLLEALDRADRERTRLAGLMVEIDAKTRELEQSREQLQSLADHLPIGVSYADNDRRFRFINKTGAAWMAHSPAEIVGKSTAEVLPAAYVQDSTALFDPRQGRSARFERTFVHPDGKLRTVDVSNIPNVVHDGTVNGYYSVVVDITERQATEQRLRQAQKLEAVGQMTGGVAHDFNNLLTVIAGNLELANEALDDRPGIRVLIETALRASGRGAALTRSLLAFARKQPLAPVALDLKTAVEEMLELVRRTMPENIELGFRAQSGLWPCEADPGQLQNALLNLVTNARDAMPDGGRLMIDTCNVHLDDDYAAAHAEVTPGQYVMLAVSDTGRGMPAEILARAFEPFFTTKDVGKGTGLGLSMVYGFARQSGGHAKIYSESGHGTTVKLYLPRSRKVAVLRADEPTGSTAVSCGETILVLEDDADVRTLAFALLRSLGYAVVDAARGEDALRLLDENPLVSLLLTDVILPGGMNGRDVAEEAQRRRPDLAVLYMSGYTENAILQQGRLVPGTHLLQKPFKKEDLAAKIRELLDARSAA